MPSFPKDSSSTPVPLSKRKDGEPAAEKNKRDASPSHPVDPDPETPKHQ